MDERGGLLDGVPDELVGLPGPGASFPGAGGGGLPPDGDRGLLRRSQGSRHGGQVPGAPRRPRVAGLSGPGDHGLRLRSGRHRASPPTGVLRPLRAPPVAETGGPGLPPERLRGQHAVAEGSRRGVRPRAHAVRDRGEGRRRDDPAASAESRSGGRPVGGRSRRPRIRRRGSPGPRPPPAPSLLRRRLDLRADGGAVQRASRRGPVRPSGRDGRGGGVPGGTVRRRVLAALDRARDRPGVRRRG